MNAHQRRTKRRAIESRWSLTPPDCPPLEWRQYVNGEWVSAPTFDASQPRGKFVLMEMDGVSVPFWINERKGV